MKTVKVKKSELMDTLLTNRAKHHEQFVKAQEAFRLEVISQLSDALQAAKDGKDLITSFKLVHPVNETEEYDEAISMLGMSVDKIIELTHEEFRNYVLDKWNWSLQAHMSNTAYLAKFDL